jgi:hypothetical protein
MADQKDSLLLRFWIYQNERFPLLAHGIAISAFTFSAVSYSRICRGKEGFIDWGDFFIGIFATVSLFFLVRIFDEFKDAEDDVKYRSYLPVPRGLISLKELKIIGWSVGLIQLLIIGVYQPTMLWLFGIVIVYLLLMGKEFFISSWLKKHQIAYITSHMFIIPLVDMYASGLDWHLDKTSPHIGLVWFFAVSYMNGLVIEFGRKLRTKENEEPGVVSYTSLYGQIGGTAIWLAILFVTMVLAIFASIYTGYGSMAMVLFPSLFSVFAIPAIRFIYRPTKRGSKLIEYGSMLWTIFMYLSLGAIPMLTKLYH